MLSLIEVFAFYIKPFPILYALGFHEGNFDASSC